MKVSVVICTYNRELYILDSLSSVKDQTCSKDLYEVILVDNNSTDSTSLKCMEFMHQKGNLNFHYYKEEKQGLSHARNRGIEVAKGEIIVFLDDDAVACKEYIHEIISFFDLHLNVWAIGGRIFPKYEAKCPTWMPQELTPLFSIIDLGKNDKEFGSNKYPVGANMAFRRSVFESCGVFNTSLGRTGKNMLGGEEKDMFYRMKLKGGVVWYAANPWIYHIIPENRTTKYFIKKQAIGVGQSEYFRTKSSFIQFTKSIIVEKMKWIASCLFACKYILLFQFSKAKMLFQFRCWVSIGLLNLEKVD
jgi:glucosyl-dolichyl phosphate glucuronosyltransferase